jgi:hypothetical protein
MHKLTYSQHSLGNLSGIFERIAIENLYYAREMMLYMRRSIMVVREFPFIGTKR